MTVQSLTDYVGNLSGYDKVCEPFYLYVEQNNIVKVKGEDEN